MKVKVKKIKDFYSENQQNVIGEFISFLQKELPLNKDIIISFESERSGNMTTGVRLPNNLIKVLTKNRLLIDVLRTLSHEWVHEFQHQKMGLKDTEKIQDIGGPEENMANILSGIYLKKFSKINPEFNEIIFGG